MNSSFVARIYVCCKRDGVSEVPGTMSMHGNKRTRVCVPVHPGEQRYTVVPHRREASGTGGQWDLELLAWGVTCWHCPSSKLSTDMSPDELKPTGQFNRGVLLRV